MALKLITAVSTEPVSPEEAKAACRIDGTEFDALLPILISAARALAEQQTGRAFGNQKWALILSGFNTPLKIQNPPLVSIDKIEYYDAANALQTLASADYIVDQDTVPAQILPAPGKSWPATYSRGAAVRIEFTCGHAANDPDLVQLKQWILLAVATWIKSPEVITGEALSALPRTFADGLLDRYRVY